MLHDSAGKLLDLGRRRRRPNTALRRAARERDACRCRFPGCDSRRVDLHHIQYWSNGGRTTPGNLISLCSLCRRRHKRHYADLRIMPMPGFLALVAGVVVLVGSA